MPKQSTKSPKTVLGKAKVILDAFSIERPSLTLTDIINATGLPKPTVFRLLQELTELGFVSQNGKRYQLGTVAFRMGLIAKQRLQLDDILNDLLMPLAKETGETIITAKLDQAEVLYLHVIESESPFRFVAGAGARRELPFGATGMALLSQLDPAEVEQILVEPFKPFTAKTITTLAHYQQRLAKTAADGIVVEHGEYYDGIMAIAIPITSTSPLTFTVVGPEDRVRPNQDLIIGRLKEAASEFKKVDMGIDI